MPREWQAIFLASAPLAFPASPLLAIRGRNSQIAFQDFHPGSLDGRGFPTVTNEPPHVRPCGTIFFYPTRPHLLYLREYPRLALIFPFP